MDQGVIRSLKANYCKNVVQKIIQSVKKKKTLPKNFTTARNANVSFSLRCTIDATDHELLSNIWNIHQKPGILHSGRSFDPCQPNLTEKDFDATTFANVDAEILPVQPPPSDAEIVGELLGMEGVSDDDDYSHEVADEAVKCLHKNELFQVIETLQRFSSFPDKRNIIQSYTIHIESQVDQHFAKKR